MTMRLRWRTSRPGFTLLEIVLATAISLLLFGALYVALDTNLRHVQVGREAVEESVLARTLLVRIGNDVSASLAPLAPPKASASSTTTNTNPTGTTDSKTADPTAPAPAQPAAAEEPSVSLVGPVRFNYGLQGDAERLVLFVSRFPRELDGAPAPTAGAGNSALTSDLRRVTYWLAGGSDAPLGLARQEVKLATSDELMGALPPDVGDEASFVIAEEVRSLALRYFNGSSWVETWDGSTGGTTPRGPPLAVEIRLGVLPAGSRQRAASAKSPEPPLKQYRHVVAIAAAQNQTTSTEP